MKSASEKSELPHRKRTRSAARPAPAPSRPSAPLGALATLPAKAPAHSQWTFLTNHGHVLVLLSRNPSLVLREVALQVGITERAVQRIIADLEAGAVIEREKVGRQNHYRIRTEQPLRHPIESHRTIGELLDLLNTSNG